MRATPPATDRPTMEPVPRPDESEEAGGECEAVSEEEGEGEVELVKVTMTSEPLAMIVVRLGPEGGGPPEEVV